MDIEIVGPGRFEEVVSAADDELREVAEAVRRLMVDVLPGVTEVAWPKQKTVGYGVGPKKMSEHFCYIGLHARHVNLGFFYGADLDDPERLLRGTGKRMRHIPLAATADVRQPAVRRLVEAASRHLPKLETKKR